MATEIVLYAVEQSIRQTERVTYETRSPSMALSALEDLGLEGQSDENNGSIDAWGTRGGSEWRLRIVDTTSDAE